MTVEPGTAILVSVRFGYLFLPAFGTCFFLVLFAGIELKHVARPFERDLPISIMTNIRQIICL